MKRSEILQVLKEFNRYREPEARASLVNVRGTQITVKITGTACRNCSFEEHAQDLVFYLTDSLGHPFKIQEIQETPEGEIVVYTPDLS